MTKGDNKIFVFESGDDEVTVVITFIDKHQFFSDSLLMMTEFAKNGWKMKEEYVETGTN